MDARRTALPALMGLMLSARVAGAEPQRRDPAAAEALFQAGIQAADRDDWAAACPKFAASFELDPAPSAMLRIAKCHEHENKLALAWADAQRAIVLNQDTPGEQRRRDLDAYARKLVAELEPRLPKLRVTVKPPGATVARDGEALPAAMVGEALPIDPGAHVLTATAPGFAPARREVTIAPGSNTSIDFHLEPAPASATPDAGATPAPGPAGTRIPAWAFVAGCAGAASAIASAVFLVDERAAQSAVDAQCKLPGHRCGNNDPSSANARLRRDFDLFVGLGAAGIVGLGAGAIGILTAPKRADAPTAGLHVEPTLGGASVRGTF